MNKEFIFILWAKWHVENFDMPMWCQFGWHMSSSNLINLMTLIWNLLLNFDVAFCNWLDKFFASYKYILNYNSIIKKLYSCYFFYRRKEWHNFPQTKRLSRVIVVTYLLNSHVSHLNNFINHVFNIGEWFYEP